MSNNKNNTQKLGLIALIAIVVSSMIGGGVDSLPKSMALQSALGPVVLAWLIGGVGIFFIANSFRILSDIRPDLQSGVYMYSREGFGAFIGFIVAWGYWLMTIFGNVAFAVMVMDSLDYFFPGSFTGGNNITSMICASILIWGFNFLVLSGTKNASILNTIGTIAKLIPLVIFVVCVGYFINKNQLLNNIWGNEIIDNVKPLGSIIEQTVAPMSVVLWSFIGIEGAVALSDRAKNKKDIGKATMIGFVISLLICILISILPFGLMPQHELSQIPTPSTAGVLGIAVGDLGKDIMNIGVLMSVLVGWLAWTMLCAEIPMIASQNGTFPKIFQKRNSKGAASASLWSSSIIMQLVVFLVYFSNNAWRTMLDISAVTVLPAYIGSTAFLFKMCLDNTYSQYAQKGKIFALISSIIGIIFCCFMVYTGGMQNVLMVPLILSLGIPVYLLAVKENSVDNTISISKRDKSYMAILIILMFICSITYLFFKLV